ncbi:MAG: polyprenyl synthetase family protein [Muribaculaceae bacterium]|nr:polyprenyl synthetase family protein [Muribaculaceae bacterium]
MQTLQDNISELIAHGLDRIHYPETAPGLYAPIAYTLESGGKRLRPRLLLSAFAAFCGSRPISEALPQALGLEIFHNFTLLHDDVMDNADIRRGRPTVHKRWNSNSAILSGDAMLTLATEYIADCPSEKLPTVLALFNKTAMEIYQGQQLDMEFEERDNVSVEEYMDMIRLKTSVLLGCACRMGAMLAGAAEEACEAMYSYGTDLGLAFQLRDDWLDTFGDPLEFGKEIGGDIVNGKKTWLLITALEESDGEIADILREDLEPEERIRQVVKVYRKLDIDSRCSALVKEYSRRAIDAIRGVDMDGKLRDFFIELAHESAERSH